MDKVSLHGIDAVHDEVVGVKGAYVKITTAIQGMVDLGIPFRFNCTMSKPAVPLIPEIARKAIHYGAQAVNFIVFKYYFTRSFKTLYKVFRCHSHLHF